MMSRVLRSSWRRTSIATSVCLGVLCILQCAAADTRAVSSADGVLQLVISDLDQIRVFDPIYYSVRLAAPKDRPLFCRNFLPPRRWPTVRLEDCAGKRVFHDYHPGDPNSHPVDAPTRLEPGNVAEGSGMLFKWTKAAGFDQIAPAATIAYGLEEPGCYKLSASFCEMESEPAVGAEMRCVRTIETPLLRFEVNPVPSGELAVRRELGAMILSDSRGNSTPSSERVRLRGLLHQLSPSGLTELARLRFAWWDATAALGTQWEQNCRVIYEARLARLSSMARHALAGWPSVPERASEGYRSIYPWIGTRTEACN